MGESAVQDNNATIYEGTFLSLNNDSSLNNVSDGVIERFENDPYLLPHWVLGLYFGFILIGSIADVIYVLALSRCKRNGTFSLLLQLTAVDAVSPVLAMIEILTINNQTWIFSHNLCPMYNGTEILVNSLQLWIIICINFHVISLWNLFKYESKRTKNPLVSCDDESNECLVTKRESTRVISIDYRRRKVDISVVIPSILIWFFCISLSIPSYTLSSSVKVKDNYVVCALLGSYYIQMFQILLLVFRVLLPIPLLLFSLIFLILKLSKTSLKDVKQILTKDFGELRVLLIFCICLTILYLATSFQRSLIHFWQINSQGFYSDITERFNVSSLYNNHLNISNNMSLTMLHYSCNTLRCALLLYLLPKFKEVLNNRVLSCHKIV
ncbi:uncharacterized protein LOC126889525 [Diabrotica virgifera virgifera]|uniref:G-protein coupled receptors family 1 profile domain-containing protein n=1 Tax=Diabrotica virgifera virgifera TaxID=50390 RepID=A0ABM5KUF6_DIAVI|nr:uncharacterized protein LOC126889525 [Diabrotica virgifera virgifera]